MNPKEAIASARELMNSHNLQDWGVELDRAKRRFGLCNYQIKMITLSEFLISHNTWETVKKTVLHEIAHALVGHENGHNSVWKAKAIELGHSGERCYSLADTVIPPNKTYIGTCPGCFRSIERYRRKKVACGICCHKYNGGKFSSAYLFTWNKA